MSDDGNSNATNTMKLEQFMEITGLDDRDFANAVLASMNYDVERAVEQHFSGGGIQNDANGEDDIAIIEHPNRSPSPEILVPEVAPRRPATYHSATHIVEQPSSSAIADRTRSHRTNGRDTHRQPSRQNRNQALIHEDDDSDMETRAFEYSPEDDDMIAESRQPEYSIPLIPKDYGTVYEAMNNFATVFDSRYRNGGISSKPAPNFFQGTLAEAIKEAFDPTGRGVEERRPLAMYLHHDRGIAANIFPPNILCSDNVANLLNRQFVLWGWDITEREHQAQLRDWMSLAFMDDIFGQAVELRARNKDLFPMLLLLIKDKGKVKIAEFIYGTDTNETAVQKLMTAVDAYTQIRLASMADEAARKERDRLREEQHAEYEASLAADRLRVEMRDKEIREQAEAEERRLQAEEAERLRRENIEKSLPVEPAENEPNLIHVKFRLPGGDMLLRRFRREENLTTLCNFLDAKGFNVQKYKFFNSDFPKKEVSNMDKKCSFETLKWPAREQIFVEEI